MQHSRLGRREFVMGLGGMAATIASRSRRTSADGSGEPQRGAEERRQAAAPNVMYVGSFTGQGRGHGEGLSVYRRNGEADPWTLIQLLKDLADPSFLIIDRQKRCLYSAHGDGTQATAYQIDRATGRLTVLNQQATGGRNGVHLAIDATGRFLALANYATGSLVVLPINQDGSLAPSSDLATMTGTPGPHETQQESSHPHHC